MAKILIFDSNHHPIMRKIDRDRPAAPKSEPFSVRYSKRFHARSTTISSSAFFRPLVHFTRAIHEIEISVSKEFLLLFSNMLLLTGAN